MRLIHYYIGILSCRVIGTARLVHDCLVGTHPLTESLAPHRYNRKVFAKVPVRSLEGKFFDLWNVFQTRHDRIMLFTLTFNQSINGKIL
jgi:hypothetical protein